VWFLIFPATFISKAQEARFIADTVVVPADGKYESDPDLATITFQVSSQEKEMKRAYETAMQSVQHIAALAEKNGLKKEDVSAGVLTVTPFYEGDRKKRARSYAVQGKVVLRVRDFSKIGAILDDSIQDGIADLRSLTYSLQDEEGAKRKAIAEAARFARDRAEAALEPKGQKTGALRYMSVDVTQLGGVVRLEPHAYALNSVDVAFDANPHKQGMEPPTLPSPEKIEVRASVQCAFQLSSD
jgi:uncharacterized protein